MKTEKGRGIVPKGGDYKVLRLNECSFGQEDQVSSTGSMSDICLLNLRLTLGLVLFLFCFQLRIILIIIRNRFYAFIEIKQTIMLVGRMNIVGR